MSASPPSTPTCCPLDRHRSFANDKCGRRAVRNWLLRLGVTRVVFEPTGRYHRGLHQCLFDAGLETVLANPLHSRRFAQALGRHAKNDKVDAAVLARYGLLDSLEATPPAPDNLRLLSDLLALRRKLVEHRDALRKLRSEVDCDQRLAAIRAFARYVASRGPEHVEWCSRIRAIPIKKAAPAPISYLEKHELVALLEVPDTSTLQGRRERALLLFLYHTGARASEAAQLKIGAVQLAGSSPGQSLVTLRGKGGKTRLCPLLDGSARALADLVDGRSAGEAVFLNRLGCPITRSGIRQAVVRCAAKAADRAPALASIPNRVSECDTL